MAGRLKDKKSSKRLPGVTGVTKNFEHNRTRNNKSEKDLKNTESTLFPADIKPMLATLVNQPVDESGWLYEIKWDGYRALAYLNEGSVELRSRNNKIFNDKFYPIYNALKEWKVDAVLDGEIIVADKNGLPDFAALQTWRSEAD